MKIVIGDMLKILNVKRYLGEIELMKYDVDLDLCVWYIFSNYLEKIEIWWGFVICLFIMF